MKIQYDKSADVLYVTLEYCAPQQCRFVENENGDVLRIDRTNDRVVGVTVISFLLRIRKGLDVVVPEIGSIPFKEQARQIMGKNYA
jgi:uncharacterized protein YuzE